MAHSARVQFQLDFHRIDLWCDGGFVGFSTANDVWDALITDVGAVTAWRMIDAVSQGTLAEWYIAACGLFAGGAEEHLLPYERQRVAIDTIESVVRIEKGFRVVDLSDPDIPVWKTPAMLYLEVGCGKYLCTRRTRSMWQPNVQQDGVLLLPHYNCTRGGNLAES